MFNEKSLQEIKGEGIEECPSCASHKISREDNESYCEDCGLVIE